MFWDEEFTLLVLLVEVVVGAHSYIIHTHTNELNRHPSTCGHRISSASEGLALYWERSSGRLISNHTGDIFIYTTTNNN